MPPKNYSSLSYHPITDTDPFHVDSIARSMERVGWVGRPIVTVGEDHKVVDGRHRLTAAERVGIEIQEHNISEQDFDRLMRGTPIPSLEDIARIALEEQGKKSKKSRKKAKRHYCTKCCGHFSINHFFSGKHKRGNNNGIEDSHDGAADGASGGHAG